MTQNFQILKALGQGSFGAVKLVRRKEDGSMYAMKEINVSKMDQRDRADQLNEIRILASIFHPNVLAYYEAFIESGKLFIITEFAELGDLDGEIQARKKAMKPFSEEDVWSVFLQVLSGLRELHNQGILHRDIKAQNVLRFANQQNKMKPIYKLADFGVSKVLKDETDFTKTQIGTPYYLCPEIWQNKQYDDKADIFSLGVLLYEIMCLKHPYDGRDMKELNRNVLKGQYQPISNRYSEQLRNLCYNLLSKDPNSRMSVKEIFIQRYVEEHYKDSPIPVSNVEIGQETALEAHVNWDDPELMETIKMNPKLMAAMAGRMGAYQNPYMRQGNRAGAYQMPQQNNPSDVLKEVQKSLPEAEYQKRKEFEKLQKIHNSHVAQKEERQTPKQEEKKSVSVPQKQPPLPPKQETPQKQQQNAFAKQAPPQYSNQKPPTPSKVSQPKPFQQKPGAQPSSANPPLKKTPSNPQSASRQRWIEDQKGSRLW